MKSNTPLKEDTEKSPSESISEKQNHLKQLQNEVQEFEKEKERIRRVMGELGGTKYASRELIANIIFFVLAITLLTLQIFFHLFTSVVSIEIAVFMISIKIIWMIHAQDKHNHFMFWVLNTIEYRINDIYKITKSLQKHLDAQDNKSSPSPKQKK